MRFSSGNRQGRDSAIGTSTPIWAQGNSKPVRVWLIRGEAELISRIDIIRKLDIAVRFGGAQFKVGQSEWETMPFNGNHRWVFPLAPTARAYAKLNGYFGKLQNSKIGVLQAQWDFGGDLSVRNASRVQKQRLRGKRKAQRR